MNKIIIASLITLVAAAIVLIGAAGIENVLAQKPSHSSLDNVVESISKANTNNYQAMPVETPEVPQSVLNIIADIF